MTAAVRKMAYVGETPWHGLGTKKTADASFDSWIHDSGLDFKALRSRVRWVDDQGQVHIVEDKHVLFRNDTREVLGHVSDTYKIFQPREVMEFFRDLTEEHGFQMETAGALFNGSRVWALAKIGKDASIIGADLIGQFLLLCTSLDGTMKTTATPTSVCVVCNNTLNMALKGNHAQRIMIGHRSEVDPKALKEQLGIATGGFGTFLAQTRALASKQITSKKAEEFVAKLLADTKMVLPTADPVKSQQFKKIMSLFNGEAMGAEMNSREGTVWGVVNAVTEYVDHHVNAKSVDNRLASAWFGRGDDLKTEAMERALTLV